MSKVYQVIEDNGCRYGDYYEWVVFITDDKEYAYKWVEKFNRIISENKDRILHAWDSHLLSESGKSFKEPMWYYKVDFNDIHRARVVGVEFRTTTKKM